MLSLVPDFGKMQIPGPTEVGCGPTEERHEPCVHHLSPRIAWRDESKAATSPKVISVISSTPRDLGPEYRGLLEGFLLSGQLL